MRLAIASEETEDIEPRDPLLDSDENRNIQDDEPVRKT